MPGASLRALTRCPPTQGKNSASWAGVSMHRKDTVWGFEVTGDKLPAVPAARESSCRANSRLTAARQWLQTRGDCTPAPVGRGRGVGNACRFFGHHTLGGVLPASDGWRPGMVLTPCHAQHHPRNAQDHPCNAQDCPCKAQSSPCGAISPINQPHPRVSRAADRTLPWGLGCGFC